MKRAHARLLPSLFLLAAAAAAAGCRDEGTTSVPDFSVAPPDQAASTDDLSVAEPDLLVPAGDMRTVPPDLAPLPEPTHFIVSRVGDGTTALTTASAAIALEKRLIDNGSLVSTTTVPAGGTNLTVAGSSVGDGHLSRTLDGKYVLIAGYDAAPGVAAIAGTAATANKRVVGRLNAAGTLDTAVAFSAFSGQNIRSAASPDGFSIWAAGSNNIVYIPVDMKNVVGTPVALASNNSRNVGIYNGQLYVSTSSGSNKGINTVGTGLPTTTTQMVTLLSGFEVDTGSNCYGFAAFDRDATAGIDQIYVADERAVASGGGVQRWKLNGTKWELSGTLKLGLTGGARSVDGFVKGSDLTLLVTTAETVTRVVSFKISGDPTATQLELLSATQLAAAGAMYAYRGIALAPQ